MTTRTTLKLHSEPRRPNESICTWCVRWQLVSPGNVSDYWWSDAMPRDAALDLVSDVGGELMTRRGDRWCPARTVDQIKHDLTKRRRGAIG